MVDLPDILSYDFLPLLKKKKKKKKKKKTSLTELSPVIVYTFLLIYKFQLYNRRNTFHMRSLITHITHVRNMRKKISIIKCQ